MTSIETSSAIADASTMADANTAADAGTVASASTADNAPPPPDDAGMWLAAISRSSRDAIIGTDVTGRVTFWNNAAEAIFGFRADEIVGQSIRAIIPADRMD